MLPRRQRIPGQQLLAAIRGEELVRDGNLTIRVVCNSVDFGRAAVIVSAKLIRGAVQRNRLKRQLLAVLTPNQLIPGWDMVVLVK